MTPFGRAAGVIRQALLVVSAFAALTSATPARAQQEFPPPQGKGRVVVVLSGADGANDYGAVSAQIAQLGYDTVLFDANTLRTAYQTDGATLKTAIEQAQHMPHALPGKSALVGFSLGGGEALRFGTRLPDLVAGAVLWYPGTFDIKDVPGFVAGLEVPVLMFAGEIDNNRGCCLIGMARSLGAAAKAAGKPFDLVTYPNTGHDFVYGGGHYNPQSYQDAFQRMAARLRDYLGG
jgi:dienelactone hydrolase